MPPTSTRAHYSAARAFQETGGDQIAAVALLRRLEPDLKVTKPWRYIKYWQQRFEDSPNDMGPRQAGGRKRTLSDDGADKSVKAFLQLVGRGSQKRPFFDYMEVSSSGVRLPPPPPFRRIPQIQLSA